MPATTLSVADYFVLLVYVAGMLALGVRLSFRQRTEDDYFLAGRSMPWFAVGVSVIASLLSSLTYLSEPGEVWRSGVTHTFGKLLSIPFEMVIVWVFCIPCMMRFNYTSAYDYLHDRFGPAARILGVQFFLLMVVLWMGFVVLATSRALSTVSGVSLPAVIAVVGAVATIYTSLGGLRAVVWTDVVQVALLIGGGLFGIFYVASVTQSGPSQWLQTASSWLASTDHEAMPWFSLNPTTRVTVITVAFNMFIWHVCTHVGNQMTVQRYFSTNSLKAARRSFVTGSLFGLGLNLMLMTVGLAMVHFYVGQSLPLERGMSPEIRQDQDLVFPVFALHRLPAGMGGGILAALLAAAMSSIDSGVNSIATVLSTERKRSRAGKSQSDQDTLRFARVITIVAGACISLAAYALNFLPADWGIVDAMPRTFNAVTAPLGGLFLAGIFIRRANDRSVVIGGIAGFVVAVVVGYSQQIAGVLPLPERIAWLKSTPISFTWVMPCALFTTLSLAAILGQSNNPATDHSVQN